MNFEIRRFTCISLSLQEQSQLIWKYRDDLQKHVSNNAMKILLELNDQNIPAGESKVDTIWQEYSLGGYI